MGTRAAQISADIAKLAPTAQRQGRSRSKGLRSSEIPDWTAGRDHLRGGNDGVRTYAIVPVKFVYRAGLTEMLDAQWANAVATNGAEPGQRRRVSVQDRDDAAMPRQARK
jgi:hypothetical protein